MAVKRAKIELYADMCTATTVKSRGQASYQRNAVSPSKDLLPRKPGLTFTSLRPISPSTALTSALWF